MDGKDALGVLEKVIEVCVGLSPDDSLIVFELAWLTTASHLRNAQLSIPGGFPAERDRQAVRLDRLAEIVRSDTPDLELERLWQEGDYAGALRHLRRLLDDGGEGA